MLLQACGGDSSGGNSTSPVSIVTVTLTPSTIHVGQTTQAAAVLQDANSNVLLGWPVAWSSPRDGVATVDQNGVVTATGVGTTTITATSVGKNGSASVTVLPGYEQRLAEIATQAGIVDIPAWLNCRGNWATDAVVAADMTLGVNAGVQGTPTFFLNGASLVGSQSASAFRTAIDAARTKALASGIPAAQYYAATVPGIPVGDSPVSGPADAWVTIVAFSDFQCSYCATAQATLSTVLPAYGADVRYVFKHFPLSFHAYGRPTARAAVCAGAQGRFWAFHDLVFAIQSSLFADL
jgi:protein-disulfide isomerase